jgi:hypothetical protein
MVRKEEGSGSAPFCAACGLPILFSRCSCSRVRLPVT